MVARSGEKEINYRKKRERQRREEKRREGKVVLLDVQNKDIDGRDSGESAKLFVGRKGASGPLHIAFYLQSHINAIHCLTLFS